MLPLSMQAWLQVRLRRPCDMSAVRQAIIYEGVECKKRAILQGTISTGATVECSGAHSNIS
jgi:hypothetical protein